MTQRNEDIFFSFLCILEADCFLKSFSFLYKSMIKAKKEKKNTKKDVKNSEKPKKQEKKEYRGPGNWDI